MIGKNKPILKSPWSGLAIVFAVFAVLLIFSWRKWADPLVDFGFQLYLPWQISTGKVLGRDVMYLPGGPLSIYYHALLFKCFGVSYRVIIFSNLVITAGMVILVYRKFLAVTNRLTATLIGLAIVMVFAVGHYSETGNYSYMSPYAHEVFHGLALSIAAVALLAGWLQKEKLRFAAAAGICAGLAFLAKPEVFVALGVCSVAALMMGKRSGAFLLKSGCLFLLGAILPTLLFLLVSDAGLQVVLSPWQAILGKAIEKNPLYLWCLGLDFPAYNLRLMFLHTVLIGVATFLLALACRQKGETPKGRMTLVFFTSVLMALASEFDWSDCGRCLPVLVLVVLGLSKPREKAFAFPFLWSVFALALLAKLGLYSRIWHYGFVLAMPAFVSGVYLLLWILPCRLESWRVEPRFFRWAAALILLTGFTKLCAQSQSVYRDKILPVGQGADTVMAYKNQRSPVGLAMVEALGWVEKNTAPESTLAVLPEGTMVNFLSRRSNPTLYPAWHPPELEAFGQDKMIAGFRAHAPDYVMLIHRDSAEYGRKYFGQEERFGKELMQWIGTNYQPVYLIGHEPLTNTFFGIKILKRKG